MHDKSLSRVQLFVTPWRVAHQAPLSIEFSRQEYWSGLPFPPPGDLLDLVIKPASLASPALTCKFSTSSTTWPFPLALNCTLTTEDSGLWGPS